MSTKARLTDLADRMASMPESTGQAAGRLEELARPGAPAPRGPSVRLTVALPRDLHQALTREVDRRAKACLAGASESAVVREALAVFFNE